MHFTCRQQARPHAGLLDAEIGTANPGDTPLKWCPPCDRRDVLRHKGFRAVVTASELVWLIARSDSEVASAPVAKEILDLLDGCQQLWQ